MRAKQGFLYSLILAGALFLPAAAQAQKATILNVTPKPEYLEADATVEGRGRVHILCGIMRNAANEIVRDPHLDAITERSVNWDCDATYREVAGKPFFVAGGNPDARYVFAGIVRGERFVLMRAVETDGKGNFIKLSAPIDPNIPLVPKIEPLAREAARAHDLSEKVFRDYAPKMTEDQKKATEDANGPNRTADLLLIKRQHDTLINGQPAQK
jgi:hypothetical protein